MKTDGGGMWIVGAGREVINPPMAGREVVYPQAGPAQGVELDMCVRVLVFGAAGEDRPRAALAVFDTLYIHPEFARAIRAEAARQIPGLGAEAIMLAATHTHSAPPLRGFDMAGRSWKFRLNGLDSQPVDTADNSRGWAGRVALRKVGVTGTMAPADPEYVAQVQAAAVRALVRAWQERRAVRAEVGLTEARLAANRRVVAADGTATNEWNDPENRHTGFCDPRVRFVVFRDAQDGGVQAILTGYGCHPVTLGPANCKPSPDFPGYLVRKLEALTGAGVVVHVNTGGADINPRIGLGAASLSRTMGEALAEAVHASLDHTVPVSAGPIGAATAPLQLRLRAIVGRGPAELLPGHELSADGRSVCTQVQAIRLGNLGLVSAPGELFQELTGVVENLSPLAHTLVVGHANDALGYLCTDTAIREGGYEGTSGTATDEAERPFLAAAVEALGEVAR